MQQFITILKKEYRQQYSLMLSMLLVCFIVQLGAFTMAMFPKLFGNIQPLFFGIALLITALYAGAAAAVSFSVEHEEKTFGFLRSLPVSPLTVMFSKTIWVVTGTIFVLISSLVLAYFWQQSLLLSTEIVQPISRELWLSFGIGIIEVTVWGFFWSPLCRKQIHAILAAYSCASLSSFFTVQIFAQNTSVLNAYGEAVSLRLGIAVVVGIAAVYSMLRWFKNTTQQNKTKESVADFILGEISLRYLPTPKTPFTALLYQSVCQSQMLLLFGIFIVAILFLSCISVYYFFQYHFFDKTNFVDQILLCVTIFFMIIFSGCIFGADQGSQSFRFLSRCGISPRKIWWSRILPFLFVYIPSLIVIIAIVFIYFLKLSQQYIEQYIMNVGEFFSLVSLFSFWLIPFSVGAFFSIYCRSMLVSVALTGAVSLLLCLWAGLGIILCRFNPLWTTLPLAVMLLVASRLRVTDWLRERQTWNSLLKPLIPFFITVITIILAVPFVRIYSIPYISLDEIETMLDKTVLAERLNPEERKKLFQETAARLTQHFTEKDIDQIENWHQKTLLFWNYSRATSYLSYYGNYKTKAIYNTVIKAKADEILKTNLRDSCTELKETIKSFPLFETWILYNYEMKTRIVKGGSEHILSSFSEGEKIILILCRYLPWEKARMLRLFNWQLSQDIVMSPKAGDAVYFDGILNSLPPDWAFPGHYFSVAIGNRLRLVYSALHLWYLEHDYTLPESLDELVGTYLDEIPNDPRTGVAMEYYPHGNDSVLFKNNSRFRHDSRPNCPFLKLESTIFVLQFQTTQEAEPITE